MTDPVQILAVDLSGPTNVAETAWVAMRLDEGALQPETWTVGAGDADLLEAAREHRPRAVALDAPLSYHPGGGDRPGDRALRRRCAGAAPRAVGVMAPTMTRMAYLTLRGMAVARLLSGLDPAPRVVEVHPGASLLLRGADPEDLRAFKKSEAARRRLIGWLRGHGVVAPAEAAGSDHLLAACAAALGAWGWARGRPVWKQPADPPWHPFDYVA